MGVLKNEKTGNYYIRIRCDNKEYEKVIGPSKTEATFALNEIKQEIRLAKLAGEGWAGFAKLQKSRKARTFQEAAREYMDQRGTAKASTKRTYADILSVHLLPEFGKASLVSITPGSIKRFQSALNKKGLSAKRINNVLGLLGYILGQEKLEGNIKDNPYDAVRKLQESKPDVNPLSEEELALVLNHISGVYKPLFIAMAYTGARPSELFALRWSDIDWKAGEIHIVKGLVRGVEGKTKTRSSERVIPMLPQVRLLLEGMKAAPVLNMTSYVFTNSRGKPLNDHMSDIWKRALKKAGLRHRPSYQLRHTFASLCLQKGMEPGYVASLLGHATLETFYRHYARWIKGASQDSKARIMEAFANTSPLHHERGATRGVLEPNVVGLQSRGHLHNDGGEGGIL